MGISNKITVVSFVIVAALWILMVSYTIVPFLLGLSLPMNKNLDLSFLTTPLVGISLLSSLLWLSIYLVHPLVTNKIINQQRALILKSKIANVPNYGVRQMPQVTIIIPARNEENVIRKTVLNCLQQTYNSFEIIVVCHNSTDRTYQEAQVVDHNNRLRVFNLVTTESGKGIALNYAIDRSIGEYICILDSDGKLDADFIQNSLPFFDEGYAAIQGKIMASNRKYNLLTNLLALEGDLYSVPFMTVRNFLDKRTPLGGTGFIIRKEILIKEGKFSKSLVDDFELSFRLYRKKHRIAFAPLSVVYDEKPPVYDIMIKQRSRWVKGHIDLLRQRISEPKDIIGTIYWLGPIFTMCGLLSIGIASFAIIFCMFAGHYPYSFAFMPIKVWLILTFSTFIMQVSFLRYEPETKNFKNVLYSALLMLFAHYWYVVLIKAFFVKSWANTKTMHGFDTPTSRRRSQTVHHNPEYLPVATNNEITVPSTRNGAIYIPVTTKQDTPKK
jgi:cellulose synthase/poly-beta-1,6-N-acetylglucosamine synthase-like glycosyltransferase